MRSQLRLIASLAVGVLGAALAAPVDVAAQIGLYHTYDEMRSELQALAAANPTRAQLISIGQGWELVGEFERRQIWALKISDNVTADEGEPEIVFVGNHHAREWISVEVPLAIAHHLLDNYATDPAIKELVDHKVIWVIPMLNPDGHAYTVSTNRCWRKNRRDNGDGTFGVDLNRNYGYQWGGTGSSGSTMSDTYRGPSAFSEPETQGLRDFLRSRANLRALISYHNFTQAVLRPWSYTLNHTAGEPPPPGELMLKDLTDSLRARILAVHGEVYKDCLFQADRLPSDRCAPPHYAADGELTDWVYHELNISAFTIEVRPRTSNQWPAPGGCFGFELPESEIAPTVQENLAAALALIRYTQEGNVMVRDYVGDTGGVPSATLSSAGWNPIFWASPDIESDPPVPVRGQTANVTVRVHNLTNAQLTGVTVQIWFTDPRITLEFPSPHATLLGEGSISIPPNNSANFSAPWSVPKVPNSWGEYHWCVGVVVKHPDDLPVSTHPVYSNNVAIRNFAPAPATLNARALHFEAINDFSIDARLDVFVIALNLPAGWSVQLDPRRPQILRPGERYLGFATVDIPPGAPASEALIQVQGALTPLRPGPARPVGSGIDFAVSYDPAGAAPAADERWYGIHVGSSIPLGSFNNDFDVGPSVAVDLENPVTQSVSLLGILAYHSFAGRPEARGDLAYTRLSLGVRRYLPGTLWIPFIEAGAGAYFADPGPDRLGLNLGVGWNRRLHAKLGWELAVAGHWVDPAGDDRVFLDVSLGLKFRF